MGTAFQQRASGMALMLAGIVLALFVLVVLPVGGFFGAHRAHHPLWVPGHTLHFVGAVLLLFGLIGWYAHQAERMGRLGFLGFVLALAGTALFVGTGLLTAFVWPVLAAQAPAALEPAGALFVAPAHLVFFLTASTLVPGYLLLGLVTWQAGELPRGSVLLFMPGVVLANLPPEPVGLVPWAVLIVGGVLFGAGISWLGYGLWSIRRDDLARPARSRPWGEASEPLRIERGAAPVVPLPVGAREESD
jgi:hypothetical protein